MSNQAGMRVVDLAVSRYGLHRVHVTSSEAIDLEAMIDQYVGDGRCETWLACFEGWPASENGRAVVIGEVLGQTCKRR